MLFPQEMMTKTLVIFIVLILPSLGDVPQNFDCPMRQLLLEFALNIQPKISMDELQEIADALNGAPEAKNCSVSPNILRDKVKYEHRPVMKWNDNDMYSHIIYVDDVNGNDGNDGNIDSPVKTLEYGIELSRRIDVNGNAMKSVILREGIYYLSDTLEFDWKDSNLLISNYDGERVVVSGGIKLNCTWKEYMKTKNNYQIYSCDLKDSNINDIKGLRINGERGMRARYPNPTFPYNTESYPCGFCSSITTDWVPYNESREPDIKISNITRNTGYDWKHYDLGIGGPCNNFGDSNAGFFCYTAAYFYPIGMYANSSILPNMPYKNYNDIIIQGWRGGHWNSFMFEVDNYDEKEQIMHFSKGGFQGSRGADNCQEFFIENVFEELDYLTEWYFDKNDQILYYVNNGTDNINELVFEITNLKVLMNFTGNMSNPVENVDIRGMTFKDTQYTYLDKDVYGMPSGGDWGLVCKVYLIDKDVVF